MTDILVLHGPNLNMLGRREPAVYGNCALATIDRRLEEMAREAGYSLRSFQSNAEHALIDEIQRAAEDAVRFVVINPAAFTHTSIALRDALLGVGIPFVEVHLSNIFKRESFRQHSYLSDVAVGVISGFGAQGYEYALLAAIEHLRQQ